MNERLTSSQIVIMRSLAMRGGSLRAISLDHRWQRGPAIPLWRRGLIEIWYRQAPSEQPALQGPYFGLTITGTQLASHFLKTPAPRGSFSSGAGEGK